MVEREYTIDADILREAVGEVGCLAVLRSLGIDTEAGSRSGDNISGLRLPPSIAADRRPSFSVHLKKWTCNDFGGHFKGTVFQLVQEAYDESFPDAVKRVARITGYTTRNGKSIRNGRRGVTKDEEVRIAAPTLKALAALKRLPVSLLEAEGWRQRGRCIRIAYYHADGAEARPQLRRADGGHVWGKRDGEASKPIVPLGLHRLAEALRKSGDVTLVEGATDWATLRHHSIPALGIPGASMTEKLEAGHLAGARRIFIVKESDAGGGETFVRNAMRRLQGIGFAGAVHIVDMELSGFKDPSALHVDDPDRFAERWRRLLVAARTAAGSTTTASAQSDSRRVESLPWQPFPIEALPEAAAEYVRAQAAALDCDEALIALPVLAVLAAAVGNARRIRLKRNWEEPAVLWTVVVADSGSKKSPALHAALTPVYRLEAEAKAVFDHEFATYQALPRAQKNRESPPGRRRFRVGDTTVESLVLIHDQNPRGLLLVRDELAGWLGSFDRYSRGNADAQSWIEMWGGRPIAVDRKSADVPALFLERPNVSVTGSIQSEVLKNRLSDALLTSGFGARLLMAEPPERPRRWTDADVAPDVADRYAALIRDLYSLPASEETVELDASGQRVFVEWVNENGMLIDAATSGPYKALLSKLEALPARLALPLTLGGVSKETESAAIVCEDTMRRAVALARWFRYESARLYDRLNIEEQSRSRDERLCAQLPEPFGWEDVASTWGIKKRQAHNVIARLCDAGLAEQVRHGEYRPCVGSKQEALHAMLRASGDENRAAGAPAQAS